ncbi:hypothetical protein GGI43DRAFT_408233 [Trichoderma evansii]
MPTIDNKGATLCCGLGQKDINGKCVDNSTTLCPNGVTTYTGRTPQCTIDVSVFVDESDGAVSDTICCANGEKASNGICYTGNAKLMPCYKGGTCDWGKGYYCAWDVTGDSICCNINQYYDGFECISQNSSHYL